MALETKESQADECFIVSVIGNPGSEERRHADWFFFGVVKPTFDAHFPDYHIMRADQMRMPGMITTQIVEKLLKSQLVIADMSFLNPNVFYEIGIRHMTGKPIIHAHHDGVKIPFDVSPYLSMEYSIKEHHKIIEAAATLKSLIESAISPDFKVDNPVTQANGRIHFNETASTPDKILFTQMESISARLTAIETAASIKPRILSHIESENQKRSKSSKYFSNELHFTPMPATSTVEFEKFTRDLLGIASGQEVTIIATPDGFRMNYNGLREGTIEQIQDLANNYGVYYLPF